MRDEHRRYKNPSHHTEGLSNYVQMPHPRDIPDFRFLEKA